MARWRSLHPVQQHAPGLLGAIPLHELTASPQSGQSALILPDISSGHPGCCGQRCFLALTWCLWLSVSILKAIGTARAVTFVSSGSSDISAAAQVTHLSAEVGGEPQGTEREGRGRSIPDSPTQPWGDQQGAHFTGGNIRCSIARSQGCPGCINASWPSTRPHREGTKGSPGTPPSPTLPGAGLSPATSHSRHQASRSRSPSSHRHLGQAAVGQESSVHS